MKRSVLLVGVDYFPYRHISEKNYWHALLPRFSERLQATISVMSVNRRPTPIERQGRGAYPVVIHNIHPARLAGALPDAGFEATAYLHRFPLGPIRRSLSLRRAFGLLDAIVANEHTGAVHFMDNFGDAMGAVKRRHPRLHVTASLPTWMDRMGRLRPIYHAIRRHSFARLDAVVTPSPATARRMLAAGFPRHQVRVIPWGVEPTSNLDPAARARGRRLLDIPAAAPLLLWSGFTQRSTPADLFFAAKLASEAQREHPHLYAAFAFKPADLRPEYEQLATEHTRVIRTDQQSFRDVLAAADLFLSPITEPGRTVTPPLTWLEAMDAGLPVVTTAAHGAADVIDDGVHGLIVPSPEEGAHAVVALLANSERLATARAAARAVVARRFALTGIVDAYLDVWGLRPPSAPERERDSGLSAGTAPAADRINGFSSRAAG